LFRSVTLPCGLTVPVHLSLDPEWTVPFAIVRLSGVCIRGHCLLPATLFDM
jgi:hypothetical protein